jgi:hypothetical protein
MRGPITAALRLIKFGNLELMATEALATFHAIEFSRCCKKVCMEGDALQIVNVMMSPRRN